MLLPASPLDPLKELLIVAVNVSNSGSLTWCLKLLKQMLNSYCSFQSIFSYGMLVTSSPFLGSGWFSGGHVFYAKPDLDYVCFMYTLKINKIYWVNKISFNSLLGRKDLFPFRLSQMQSEYCKQSLVLQGLKVECDDLSGKKRLMMGLFSSKLFHFRTCLNALKMLYRGVSEMNAAWNSVTRDTLSGLKFSLVDVLQNNARDLTKQKEEVLQV